MIQGELCMQILEVNLCASMACLLDCLHQAGRKRLVDKRQEWMAREKKTQTVSVLGSC